MAKLLVALVMMIIMNFSNIGEAQITCTTVDNNLLPCASYVMSGGENVPSACCDGFNGLVSMAKTPADRQSICSCVKSFLTNANDGQISNAASIPPKCGVNIHFIISRNMDCSKVTMA